MEGRPIANQGTTWRQRGHITRASNVEVDSRDGARKARVRQNIAIIRREGIARGGGDEDRERI